MDGRGLLEMRMGERVVWYGGWLGFYVLTVLDLSCLLNGSGRAATCIF